MWILNYTLPALCQMQKWSIYEIYILMSGAIFVFMSFPFEAIHGSEN